MGSDIKINIAKISELCNNIEGLNEENFGGEVFSWYQSSNHGKFKEYETKLTSNSIEIALLEAYKNAIKPGTHGHFDVKFDASSPEKIRKEFTLSNLLSDNGLTVNLPLVESLRTGDAYYGERSWVRYKRINNSYRYDNFFFDEELSKVKSNAAYIACGQRGYHHSRYGGDYSAEESTSLTQVLLGYYNQYGREVDNNISTLGQVIGQVSSFGCSTKELRLKLAMWNTFKKEVTAFWKDCKEGKIEQEEYTPFSATMCDGEVGTLRELYKKEFSKLEKKRLSTIKKIDAYIRKLKKETPLSLEEFKQDHLAKQEALRAKEAAEAAKALAVKRAKEKKAYEEFHENLKISGYGFGETDATGKEKKAYGSEHAAKIEIIRAAQRDSILLSCYSKKHYMPNGEGDNMIITRWFLTSQDSVRLAS